MTPQKAIEIIKIAQAEVEWNYPMNYSAAFDEAIKALEKQIPYEPKEYEDKHYDCKCGNVTLMKWEKYPKKLMSKGYGLPYCLSCGQKLDWGDDE